jgi:uncharacterized protein (DUF1800 family)
MHSPTELLERTAPQSGANPSPDTRPNTSHGTVAAKAQAPSLTPSLALAALASASLAACGGGGDTSAASGGSGSTGPGNTGGGTIGTAVANREAAPATDLEAARFLQQAQFSSTEAEIAQLRSAGGYATWLGNQFKAPASQSTWDWLEQRGYGENNIYRYFFSFSPIEHALWKQLFSAPDAMRQRLALALSEFFVVGLSGVEFTWRSHAMASWWDMLARHAFGNFRDLLRDVSLHPAMGYYLNTKGNQKEDPRTGRLPDENYARELMQLFSIGLTQLNLDGSNKLVGGKPQDSYTQDDVTNLARVFTGYDFDRSDGVRESVLRNDGTPETYDIESKAFARKPMLLDPKKHSVLEAKFLGATVPAGASGEQALNIAIDTVFNHPNTAPFFCRQMIQRLVTSNPSPAYVQRVASVFVNNGAGVRGDMKSVWAAIFLDQEARSAQSLASPTHGKLREPMLRLVQWGRTFGATSAGGYWKLFDLSNAGTELGQSPLRSPSVFNFFRPGFVPPGTAMASAGATAPEFQIVNETSVGGYLNFMQNVLRRGFTVPEPNLPQSQWNTTGVDITANYTPELAVVHDPAALVAKINLKLCAGQLSAATQSVMVGALSATALRTTGTATEISDSRLDRVCAAILMAMACSEYLIQK